MRPTMIAVLSAVMLWVGTDSISMAERLPSTMSGILKEITQVALALPITPQHGELFEEVALAQVRAGNVPEAETVITKLRRYYKVNDFHLVEPSDGHVSGANIGTVHFLLRAMGFARRLGLEKWASQIGREVLTMVEHEPEPYAKIVQLKALAGAYDIPVFVEKKDDFWKQALAVARQTYTGSSVEVVLGDILLSLAQDAIRRANTTQARVYLEALQRTVATFQYPGPITYVLPKLAQLQAELGDVVEAERSLDKVFKMRSAHLRAIENQDEHYEYYSYLKKVVDLAETAGALMRAGKQAEARRMFKASQEALRSLPESERSFVSKGWSSISMAAVTLGDFDFAIQAASCIKDSAFVEEPHKAIVEGLFKNGRIEEAKRLALYTYDRPLDLVFLQLHSGDVTGAAETLESLEISENPSMVRTKSHLIFLNEGADSALTWASQQKTPSGKAYALLGVADCLLTRAEQRHASLAQQPEEVQQDERQVQKSECHKEPAPMSMAGHRPSIAGTLP